MVKTSKKSKSKPRPATDIYTRTENVVVSASVNRELPLERLATKLEGGDYNPEQFPGLILKMETPIKASALLFSSGRIICTGTKSKREAKKAVAAIVDRLNKIGIKVDAVPDIAIQNMVASGSVGAKLNLNEIVFKFDNTEYEPEQFPGLVYKLTDSPVLSNITFLLFGTGKIVITGARSEQEIKDALVLLRKNLKAGGELK